MQKLVNKNGITVRQLKELVKDLPEANDDGEEFELWIETHGGLSNVCKNISPLNKREAGQDIMLSMDDETINDRLMFSAIHVGTGVQTVFNNDKPVNEVLIFVDTLIARLEELKTQALLRELTN